MEQRMTFVTLGVKDLEAMKKFYSETLGWKPMMDNGGVVFYKLNGIIFSLFPTHELAKDATIKDDGKGFKQMSFAINFNSEEEVNKAFEELRKKKVTIIKEPQKVFWGGYSGYFEDIEHNLWEIAHNPFLEMDGAGNVLGHK